eukprot:gene41043-biopygen2688
MRFRKGPTWNFTLQKQEQQQEQPEQQQQQPEHQEQQPQHGSQQPQQQEPGQEEERLDDKPAHYITVDVSDAHAEADFADADVHRRRPSSVRGCTREQTAAPRVKGSRWRRRREVPAPARRVLHRCGHRAHPQRGVTGAWTGTSSPAGKSLVAGELRRPPPRRLCVAIFAIWASSGSRAPELRPDPGAEHFSNDLPAGTRIHITSIVPMEEDGRIRARIDEPCSGWISLEATPGGLVEGMPAAKPDPKKPAPKKGAHRGEPEVQAKTHGGY